MVVSKQEIGGRNTVILSFGFVIALDLKLAIISRLDRSLPFFDTRVDDFFGCCFPLLASFVLTVL